MVIYEAPTQCQVSWQVLCWDHPASTVPRGQFASRVPHPAHSCGPEALLGAMRPLSRRWRCVDQRGPQSMLRVLASLGRLTAETPWGLPNPGAGSRPEPPSCARGPSGQPVCPQVGRGGAGQQRGPGGLQGWVVLRPGPGPELGRRKRAQLSPHPQSAGILSCFLSRGHCRLPAQSPCPPCIPSEPGPPPRPDPAVHVCTHVKT